VSDKDACPLRVTLLNMIVAGEHSPHLDVCEECAAFVAAATDAVTAFTDRGDVERAVEDRIDAVLAGAPARHWSSVIVGSPELRRSVVIRDLLRRADAFYGSDSRAALDLTTAAVTVWDVMVASGEAPSMELRFLALKEHATALHRMGKFDESIAVLGRGWPTQRSRVQIPPPQPMLFNDLRPPSRWPASQNRIHDAAQFRPTRSLYGLNSQTEVDGGDILREGDRVAIRGKVSFGDRALESFDERGLIRPAPRHQLTLHRVIVTARQ
jgi:hypothetical protein